MEIKKVIFSATKIDDNQTGSQEWIEKPKTKPKSLPRARGVSPYDLHINENLLRREKINNRVGSEQNFSDIIPSVREVSGGYNVQSNDVIERHYREQRKLHSQDSDESNSSLTYTTASSITNDSYRTSFHESFTVQSENKSERELVINQDRIKKNALMRSLIENDKIFPDDKEEVSTISSNSFYDTPASESDFSTGIEKLNIKEDQETMQNYRVGLLFRSEEDEDIYCHPFTEMIKKDPEWLKQRLRRKGVETTLTPRQYYMSFSNDDFGFVSSN